MITTPTSFTHEYLSSLKFKELQKLSVQFHVNKRWAKKQELIENLLALREKNKVTNDNKQEDEKEWRDGATIFNELNFNKDNEVNRRFTYNISTQISADPNGIQSEFQLHQKDGNPLCETINSRETYDIPQSEVHFNVEPLADSRATFDIPPKQNLISEVDPRATFDVPQKGRKLLEESEINELNAKSDEENLKLKTNANSKLKKQNANNINLEEELGKIKFNGNLKDSKHTGSGEAKSQVKMLTIPCARVTRRTRKDGEASKNDISPIKMSKKSINIKKSTRLPVSKSELVKSPAFSSVKNSVKKQSVIQSLTKAQPGGNFRSKVPVRLQFTEEKPKPDVKDNSKKVLQRRLSKPESETLGNKSSTLKVNFGVLPASAFKNSKVATLKKNPLSKDPDERRVLRRLNSSVTRTPAGDKPTVVSKPITATKMPDFNKIHKRQFEQMDSLHDYIKKKEERIRKLFGTPQPGQQLQVHNKSAPLFRFQSRVGENEGRGKENLKSVTTPSKRKEHDSKTAQKEAFKSRLPPSKLQTDIKDKNRSHIHGVRTNKRFELQMKLRNM